MTDDQKRLAKQLGVDLEDKTNEIRLDAFPGVVFSPKEYESLFEPSPRDPEKDKVLEQLTLDQQREIAKKLFRVDLDEE
jgi:hypothetical protein